MKNVFIIGSKGIPANYGGFETFVEKLTEFKKNEDIKYHVSCLAGDNEEFTHNNARCFNIKVPNVGPAKAIIYDVLALKESIEYIKNNNIEEAIIYILACRIGPFLGRFKEHCRNLGIKLYLNPDGHEWKRAKWNFAIRKYWKKSEKLMVKHADLVICDSKAIEEYINELYKKYNPNTCFIAYGSETTKSLLSNEDENFVNWLNVNQVKEKEYYLIVGRFVPENNYKLIIEEFMKSDSKKDLVIISNVEKNKFYDKLLKDTKFTNDSRIKFIGTVYNQELLKKIRECAFAYIHGHEVGGTNPSLLEALASTDINILLNVNFNKEVAKETAIYFDIYKEKLHNVIKKVEVMSYNEVRKYAEDSTKRIQEAYSWDLIVNRYEEIIIDGFEKK